MSNYDRREDGVYLLTGKKAKEKDIVIKMGSSVSEIHLMDAMTRTTYNLVWTIEADDLEDIRYSYKCSFEYNNIKYNNISLTDTANIYQHDNMFVIVLFSQIIFILLIIYKVIYQFCYIKYRKLKNTK